VLPCSCACCQRNKNWDTHTWDRAFEAGVRHERENGTQVRWYRQTEELKAQIAKLEAGFFEGSPGLVRKWYRDRDFPEIKASNCGNPPDILAVVEARDELERVISEHNGAIHALVDELIAKDNEIKQLNIQLALFKISGKECRNEKNV